MPDYRCEILADSLNPSGCRLTTFEVTFPRMVLADLTRHRVFSYSFESTRAIPVRKRIDLVRNDPYVPIFRGETPGMGGGYILSDDEQEYLQAQWRQAASFAADTAQRMIDAGKEHVGRILEPYSWITGIISGTSFDNYFGLRAPPLGEEPDPEKWGAQIELQIIANMMQVAYHENEPEQLGFGDWHLPLVTDEEKQRYNSDEDRWTLMLPKISAGRCASTSYLRQHDANNTAEVAFERWEVRLAPSAHWSPGEHPAVALHGSVQMGNFTGFRQLRKFYPDEAVYTHA